VYTKLSENLKGRDHTKHLGIHGKTVLEWVLGKLWTGCIWLSTGTSGRLL